MEILNRQRTGTRYPDEKLRRAAYGHLTKVQVAIVRIAPDDNGYWIETVTETIIFETMNEAWEYIKQYEGHINILNIYAK